MRNNELPNQSTFDRSIDRHASPDAAATPRRDALARPEGIARLARELSTTADMFLAFACEHIYYDGDPEGSQRAYRGDLVVSGGRRGPEHIEFHSTDDPISGTVGGWYGGDRAEFTRVLYAGDEDYVLTHFGFRPVGSLELHWHFDAATLLAAKRYVTAHPESTSQFWTTYYFDHAGHLLKTSVFPGAIPDNRPDIGDLTNLTGTTLKTVVSPVTDWDLEVSRAAVRAIGRKLPSLAEQTA